MMMMMMLVLMMMLMLAAFMLMMMVMFVYHIAFCFISDAKVRLPQCNRVAKYLSLLVTKQIIVPYT